MKIFWKRANYGFGFGLSFQLLVAFVSQDEDAQEDRKKR